MNSLHRTMLLILLLVPDLVLGWGGSSDQDASMYGDSFSRDWLYDSTAIAMKLEGCVWGYVMDIEEVGCMEAESEDGTYYWYMMANCRRAQAAFSLYATDSSSSIGCSSSTFKESFVTKIGLTEFIGYLKSYDPNSPFSDDDDNNNDDDKYGGWDLEELPLCEEQDGSYIGLSCGEDGSFTIDYFNDEYCLSSAGTYDTLDSINYLLSTYSNCAQIYSSNDGDGSLFEYLIPYSESCSSLDSSFCSDDSAMSSRRNSASSGGHHTSVAASIAQRSWGTKLKYAVGGILLLGSFIMFTGILFTNRRRRRALMQRRFKQASRHRREKDDRSRKSSSKRSKSKEEIAEKRSRTRRSKSKSDGERRESRKRESRPHDEIPDDEDQVSRDDERGVMT